MKKRILSLLLVLLMAVSMLAACGGNSNKTASFEVPEGGYDGSAVTITFYHTMGATLREKLDAAIVEFNKLYPNIKIEHQQVGSYDDVRNKISKEITAGNQPNIAYCYPDHVAMYNISKAVVQLDNLIGSKMEVTRADGTKEVLGLTDAQINDFIPAYYNEGKSFGDGLMYTLPLSKSTEVLYYNKTFFTEHNLKVPTTWDEMEEICKKMLEIDPDCIPFGYDSESNWFITMCEQLGTDYTSANGEHYLFNNDDNKAFVKRFRDWYQKGYFTTETLYGGYTSSLFTGEDDFQSYMCIGSSAGASYQCPKVNADGTYPFEVGVAPIPQANPNSPKVISQGPNLCIFQKENPQEVIASWLFVKYLTTDVVFQGDFSEASGYIPVIKSVQEDEYYKTQVLDKADGNAYLTASCVKLGLQQAQSYYTSPAFKGSSTARQEVGTLMSDAFAKETTDVDKMINELFENAIKKCKYYD